MAKAGRGGHLVFFTATLPSIGAGAVPNTPPAEQDLYDTDKEVSLHLPRSATWMTIGEECAEEGVGVSMFLAPRKFMDVGSVSVVSTLTGGELFWHPKFLRERDEPIVCAQLARLVSRNQGYNCMVRVRCSNGRYMHAVLSSALSPSFVSFTNHSVFCFTQVYKSNHTMVVSYNCPQPNSLLRISQRTALSP